MIRQFKPMYNKIIENINVELDKVVQLLASKGLLRVNIPNNASYIFKNHNILNAINEAFRYDSSLGSNEKERITNGLHKLLTEHNRTHSRNPIMLSP
jgi:trans-aconitate methyltransferase